METRSEMPIELSLREVIEAVKTVSYWREGALHLGVPKYVIDRIEQEHKRIEDQKMDAFNWWLKNREASWLELSIALRKTEHTDLAEDVLKKGE